MAASTSSLVARGITARLGGRIVLDRVDLEVKRGEIVVIVGPNGAGKTTLLEALAGLRAATGEVRWGDALCGFRERAVAMAYLPDDVVLPSEMTVARALGPRFAFDIGELQGARASELSRGEAKRVQLAAVLASDRPVLLLDEPFGAFDPRQLRELLPVVRDATRERAVLVTVHQMRTAELIADRIVLLAGGKAIASGTVAELRARAKVPDAPFDDVFLELLP